MTTVEEALAREPRALVIRDRREAMITLMTIARLENATVHGLVQYGERTPIAYAVGWNGLAWSVSVQRWIWCCASGVFARRSIGSLGSNIYPSEEGPVLWLTDGGTDI